MGKSVFTNDRTLVQPEFHLPEDLKANDRQVMDGLELLKKIPNVSVPLVFFDPQYRGILNKLNYGNEGDRQQDRFLLPQMEQETINEFLTEIERILMSSGHLMFWVDKFTLVGGSMVNDVLKPVDMITWNKIKIGLGYRTRHCSEYLVIYQKLPLRAKGVWKIHNIPDTWPERADKSHPHAKPLGLLEKLIEAVTNDGDIVVDPAAGGYNTLRATKNTGRNFLGCDLVEVGDEATL